MNNGAPFYFETGKSALRCILTALLARVGYAGGDQPVRSILDLGCGYGRVTRWMRAAFPEAHITVADLNRKAALWCAERFNAAAPVEAITANRYDVIFLGSVFTHLSEPKVRSMVRELIGALRDNGVLVFTTQGRFCVFDALAHPEARIYQHLGREVLQSVAEDFNSKEFAFAPNPTTPDYGTSWIDPRWFVSNFAADEDFFQIVFQEKGWDNFQDLYAYMKSPLQLRARSRR